jgi:RNA polymerase sigma-70 factor (sigma-E family)
VVGFEPVGGLRSNHTVGRSRIGKNLRGDGCVGQSVSMSRGRDDEAEFRAFVESTERTLLRVALGLTLDRGAAEDLVQTAYLRTYARWPRLRDGDPAAYARRIVVNENTDRWRRHRGRESLVGDVPDRPFGDAASDVVERDAVVRALAELSDSERRVVVLRYLADLSESDTADALRMPLGTVKSVTHRAVGKLRASSHLSLINEVSP